MGKVVVFFSFLSDLVLPGVCSVLGGECELITLSCFQTLFAGVSRGSLS